MCNVGWFVFFSPSQTGAKSWGGILDEGWVGNARLSSKCHVSYLQLKTDSYFRGDGNLCRCYINVSPLKSSISSCWILRLSNFHS